MVIHSRSSHPPTEPPNCPTTKPPYYPSIVLSKNSNFNYYYNFNHNDNNNYNKYNNDNYNDSLAKSSKYYFQLDLSLDQLCSCLFFTFIQKLHGTPDTTRKEIGNILMHIIKLCWRRKNYHLYVKVPEYINDFNLYIFNFKY